MWSETDLYMQIKLYKSTLIPARNHTGSHFKDKKKLKFLTSLQGSKFSAWLMWSSLPIAYIISTSIQQDSYWPNNIKNSSKKTLYVNIRFSMTPKGCNCWQAHKVNHTSVFNQTYWISSDWAGTSSTCLCNKATSRHFSASSCKHQTIRQMELD